MVIPLAAVSQTAFFNARETAAVPVARGIIRETEVMSGIPGSVPMNPPAVTSMVSPMVVSRNSGWNPPEGISIAVLMLRKIIADNINVF